MRSPTACRVCTYVRSFDPPACPPPSSALRSVLKDVNLNVVSAEIDTVGPTAQDEFFVTYHGEPLTSPMVTLVTNALQYYLSLAEVAKEESY